MREIFRTHWFQVSIFLISNLLISATRVSHLVYSSLNHFHGISDLSAVYFLAQVGDSL